MRAVLHEQADAEAVLARLLAQGFAGTLARERFAGEDDDEDHPWAVLTDAPAVVVELLVEDYDGWVDHEETAGPRPAPSPSPGVPVDLPRAPRRSTRDDGG